MWTSLGQTVPEQQIGGDLETVVGYITVCLLFFCPGP